MKKFHPRGIVFLVNLYVIVVGMLSDVCAKEKFLKDSLQKPFELHPKYEVGEKDFYRMRTVYLTMNDSGSVAHTQVLDGYYSREVTRIQDGKQFDRLVWKYVRKGQSFGKGEIKKFEVMSFTQNFQYDFSAQEWEPHHFPVDLTPIPKTLEGWCFVVKLLDAHTFDAILRLDEYEETLACVGDTAHLPAEGVPVVMDFPPLFTDTHFTNAPFYTVFEGVTLYKGEPCAILAFRSDDSRVRMVVNMMDMKLPTDGVSYYWGKIYLSLETRRIAWGQILERVDSITTAFIQAGTPMRQVIRREITLERMDQSEYDDPNPEKFRIP